MPQGASGCKTGRCWQTVAEKERNTNRKWAFHQAARPGSRMHCLSSSHKSIPEHLWLCMKDACAGCLSAWPLNFISNLPLISSCYQTWQTGLFSALVDGTACFKTEQTTKRHQRYWEASEKWKCVPTSQQPCSSLNLRGQKSWGEATLQPSCMPTTQSVTASAWGSDLLTITLGWSAWSFGLEDPKRLTSHIPF